MAHDGPHIVPKTVLLSVFGALIVLTGITVGVAYVPLGPFSIPVAIAIAATKAALVVLFFMHLKYDSPVNSLTFAMGTVFVVIFLGITLQDMAFLGDLRNVSSETIREMEAEEERARQRLQGIPTDSLRIAPSDYSDPNRGASLPMENGAGQSGEEEP